MESGNKGQLRVKPATQDVQLVVGVHVVHLRLRWGQVSPNGAESTGQRGVNGVTEKT